MPESRSDVSPVPGGEVVVPPPDLMAGSDGGGRVWATRRDTILTILLWGAAIGIIVWLLSHIVQVVLLLSISAIIAFAIAPITVVLERFLPRFLAILVVYVLALARQMPYPYAEAKALSTYGDLLVANGQPERARDQYEAALTILRSVGEVLYTERIERALAEIRQ
jgi:hypothetical protein